MVRKGAGWGTKKGRKVRKVKTSTSIMSRTIPIKKTRTTATNNSKEESTRMKAHAVVLLSDTMK